MYIQNGIAYAGEQTPCIRVIDARPLEGYQLLVTFSTGETGIFDFAPYLEKPCFQPLKDLALFRTVTVAYGTLCWNDGDIDIAPETVYAHAQDTGTESA